MDELFNNLVQPIAESDSLEIEGLIQEIERAKGQSESLCPDAWNLGLQRLSPYRLRSSGSLKRGQLKGWIKANSYTAQQVMQERRPTPKDIAHINSLILAAPEVSIRTTDIYIGPRKACSAEKLPELLAYFYDHILPCANGNHPLIDAALIRYWLVSLHPFKDGNGRTSVMLCDWLLLNKGYLPLSFKQQIEAVIGTFEDYRVNATPGRAVTKTLKSVLHSYQIINQEE